MSSSSFCVNLLGKNLQVFGARNANTKNDLRYESSALFGLYIWFIPKFWSRQNQDWWWWNRPQHPFKTAEPYFSKSMYTLPTQISLGSYSVGKNDFNFLKVSFYISFFFKVRRKYTRGVFVYFFLMWTINIWANEKKYVWTFMCHEVVNYNYSHHCSSGVSGADGLRRQYVFLLRIVGPPFGSTILGTGRNGRYATSGRTYHSAVLWSSYLESELKIYLELCIMLVLVNWISISLKLSCVLGLCHHIFVTFITSNWIIREIITEMKLLFLLKFHWRR